MTVTRSRRLEALDPVGSFDLGCDRLYSRSGFKEYGPESSPSGPLAGRRLSAR